MKLLTIFILSFYVSSSYADSCLENRGSLDIGSGTTKGLVAEVNVCEHKIVRVLFEDRLPLPFNEALEKSPDQKIPEAMITTATPAMSSLLEKMKKQKPTTIHAVATSVFRVARNGKEVAAQLAKALQIPVTVISQDEEAQLGFLSALAAKNLTASANVIVWDIGGGSMQMYTLVRGRPQVFRGNLASVTFKNKVLEVLKFKKPTEATSPNPLGMSREAAIQLAKNHAYLNVPAYFKQHAATTRWIGVGGVLSSSVQGQASAKAEEFSEEELDNALKLHSELSDEQIHSDYRTTDVTNLALVLGYMRALKIPKVETAKVSLGPGVLLKELTPRKAH